MDTILETHVIIQSVAQPENAFVDNHDTTNINQQKKKDMFLDRIRYRISDILKYNNIKPQLFLVREFSDNIEAARIKNKLFMHSHILIFIEKEKYNDGLLDKLTFCDKQHSTRIVKLRNHISKDRQNLNTMNILQSFIEYLLKDINKNSKYFKDYQFNNCPIREYIENLIQLKVV